MKILHINSAYAAGSTGRIVHDIHRMLVEQGHDSFVAYGRGQQVINENIYKIGSNFDIYFHVALTRIFDKHGFGSIRATEKLVSNIEKINPDVIHLHNIHGYYVNIEILFNFLKKINKKIVWTLHDCWSFTGHCAYFDYVGCSKWKTGCHNCPQKNEYPRSLIYDRSLMNYEQKKKLFTGIEKLTIVTPSVWLSKLVKESFLKQYDVKVINNGIDLDIFKPTKKNFREKYDLIGKYIILGVANVWDTRKGLAYFLNLNSILRSDEVIVLIGLSDSQINILPSGILGFSRTTNIDELVDVYSSSNVFINPTLEDNFPTTNIEALACGLPVITFNSGGSSEMIDTSCGLSISNFNINEIRAAIDNVKNSTDINSINCLIKANEYNKNIKFLQYIDLYKSIVE